MSLIAAKKRKADNDQRITSFRASMARNGIDVPVTVIAQMCAVDPIDLTIRAKPAEPGEEDEP